MTKKYEPMIVGCSGGDHAWISRGGPGKQCYVCELRADNERLLRLLRRVENELTEGGDVDRLRDEVRAALSNETKEDGR
jgi:hypothetical protein